MNRLIRAIAIAIILSTSVIVAGCSGRDSAIAVSRASELAVLNDAELGGILVDGEGDVLYVFEPDAASVVSCTFTCATNWPPLAAVKGKTPSVAAGADATLVGSLPNPAGGEVITYNGWPLYRYAADREPGERRGQDVYLNGGSWYMITPDGTPVIP